MGLAQGSDDSTPSDAACDLFGFLASNFRINGALGSTQRGELVSTGCGTMLYKVRGGGIGVTDALYERLRCMRKRRGHSDVWESARWKKRLTYWRVK